MSRILTEKKQRLQYNRGNIQKAFEATCRGMSVYRAAREYCVPESTLRDRTRGKVDLDIINIGFQNLFSSSEEHQLVDHIKYMASIGYGYNKSSIQHMAKDLAVSLGKTVKSQESLSNCWFYGFMNRWPDLKLVQPQKLSNSRAKSASAEIISNYFKELSTILTINGLRNKPDRIFNIDETGISTEHSPPKIVCDKENKPQSITSPRTSTVTIIAGGNAIGNQIPPYYVFPGKRWNNDLLNGCAPGSAGEMTESGWSNTSVFQNYLTKHFSSFVNMPEGKEKPSTLILYDGHKSHINLILTDWAKKHNVILFVLPPHTSHLTQPLDVGVFGPLKTMYNKECSNYLRENPGINITKYQVAALTAKPYCRAMSAENLTSAFQRTGIYPFNNTVISDMEIAPATIYKEPVHEESAPSVVNTVAAELGPDNAGVQPIHHTVAAELGPDNAGVQPIPRVMVTTSTGIVDVPGESTKLNDEITSFLDARKIVSVIKKPKKKFQPPFLAGNLLKEKNQTILSTSTKSTKKRKIQSSSTGTGAECCIKKKSKGKGPAPKSKVPKPTTSKSNKSNINLSSSDFTDEDDEEEKCCVCNKWQPEELRNCTSIIFVKWGKCDVCPHWTHLSYCSPVRVIRRDSEFKCPHCVSD